jgi:hypothetical protein
VAGNWAQLWTGQDASAKKIEAASPYIWRFIAFRRLTCPSTWPLLLTKEYPFATPKADLEQDGINPAVFDSRFRIAREKATRGNEWVGRFTYDANTSLALNGANLPAALYIVNRPTSPTGAGLRAFGSRHY